MSDLHGYDAWDDVAAGPPAATSPEPGGRPPIRGPRRAPLVLVAAAVLLVVALMVAMSTLRPTSPEMAATARPPSTPPSVAPATDRGQEATSSSGTSVSSAPTTPPGTPASGTATATSTGTATGRPTDTVTVSDTATVTVSASKAPTESAREGDAAVQVLDEIAAREQGRRPRSGQIVVHLQNRSPGSRDPYIAPPSGGSAWTAADILAYHNEASARAGGATLLKDGDRWISATWNPAWRTREQAIAWCYVAYPEFGRNYEANNQLRSRCYVTTG